MKLKFWRRISLILTVTLAILGYIIYEKPYIFGEISPFSTIEWKKDVPSITINGEKYEWLGSEGKSMKVMIDFAKEKYRDQWRTRISEDYSRVFKAMGHWTYFSTSMQLRNAKGETIIQSFPLRTTLREKVIAHRKKSQK